MTTSTFGELVRESRLARGMSMGQLASSVGRTAASVRRWERDEVVPGSDVVLMIAEVLELDPETLAALAASDGEDPDEAEAVVEAVVEASPPEPEPPAASPMTDAMPIVQPAPTTVSPQLEVDPHPARPTLRYYLDHLLDPERPYLGYLRAAATVVVGFVLLWILVWALGALFTSLGEVWDQFDRGPDTTEAAFSVIGLL